MEKSNSRRKRGEKLLAEEFSRDASSIKAFTSKIEHLLEERGIVALDAKIFSEIVRKLPDNDVVIETDSNLQTTITCEKAKFHICGKSGEDFSYLPYVERNDSIEVSQFTLKEVIRQTIFSIADNENNKLMTGELFEVTDSMLKVVSLDGHRISIRKVELKEDYPEARVVGHRDLPGVKKDCPCYKV